MFISRLNLEKGTFLLFDDDCGICTTFSSFFRRLLPNEIRVIPMHDPSLVTKGALDIGFEKYWKSFHILNGNVWTTDGDAIIELFKLLPASRILTKVARAPFVYFLLGSFLRHMQRVRKQSCAISSKRVTL